MFTRERRYVAFGTCRCTRYARAARPRALRAWEMHLEVPNRTKGGAPVKSCKWSGTAPFPPISRQSNAGWRRVLRGTKHLQ